MYQRTVRYGDVMRFRLVYVPKGYIGEAVRVFIGVEPIFKAVPARVFAIGLNSIYRSEVLVGQVIGSDMDRDVMR